MAVVVIKSNASQVTFVLIKDFGVIIPASGGSETFVENKEIFRLQASEDLREFLVDDVYGAGSSTLILNDGTSDIVQADALNFLDTVILPEGDQVYGVVKTNENAQIETDLAFNDTAEVTDLILGNDGDANNFKIVNLATPTSPLDAVNKAYVDGLVSAITKTSGEALLLGDIVVLDPAGTVFKAEADFSTDRWRVFGTAAAAVGPATSVSVLTGQGGEVPMLFATAPAASSNGLQVYLSAVAGEITLTPPQSSGNVVMIIGILTGADGATLTPSVLFSPQYITRVP